MKQISNLRKAVAGVDDVTLTRWIKEPGRHTSDRAPALMSVSATGTRFPSRVLPIATMRTLLVSGHSNVKIGRDVRKGRFKGYWIYTLSLEERVTCPASCQHWRSCYGNNMPFAKRVDHADPDFLPRLETELAGLVATRGRRGVLVRLHALGDFYSAAYVGFWRRMLRKHPTLAVFGYTARDPLSNVGLAIGALMRDDPGRFAVRWSDGGKSYGCTVGISSIEERPDNAFVCPEQTGQTRCCATCAACWSTSKNVAFLSH